MQLVVIDYLHIVPSMPQKANNYYRVDTKNKQLLQRWRLHEKLVSTQKACYRNNQPLKKENDTINKQGD